MRACMNEVEGQIGKEEVVDGMAKEFPTSEMLVGRTSSRINKIRGHLARTALDIPGAQVQARWKPSSSTPRRG